MIGLEQFLATALLPGSWPLSFHWTTSAVSTLGGEHFLRLSPTSFSSSGMPAVSFDSLNSNSVSFLLNVYYSLKTITTSCKGSHLFCPNSFSQFWVWHIMLPHICEARPGKVSPTFWNPHTLVCMNLEALCWLEIYPGGQKYFSYSSIKDVTVRAASTVARVVDAHPWALSPLRARNWDSLWMVTLFFE